MNLNFTSSFGIWILVVLFVPVEAYIYIWYKTNYKRKTMEDKMEKASVVSSEEQEKLMESL